MITIPLSQAKSNFSQIVEKVSSQDEEIVITKNGRPVAVLISLDEFEGWKETEVIKLDEEFMNDIKKSMKSFEKKARLYSLEELFNQEQ